MSRRQLVKTSAQRTILLRYCQRPEIRSAKWRIPNWRRLLPYIGGMAALLLFAAALAILHRHAQAYRPSEVRRALRALQAWQPFAALGLAAASYVLLTLYDGWRFATLGGHCRIVASRSPPSPDMPSATRWASGVSSALQYVT
jgi:hypothetical protein